MDKLAEKELKRIAIINEYCDGISPEQEISYIYSILYSAERSLAAFDRYEDLIKIKTNATILISTVQEAIGHAGTLSRYFWVSRMGYKSTKELNELRKKRADKLRNKFGLIESSPLKERSLRDAWEHFDERLDIFLITHFAGCFFPTPILDKHTLADEPGGRIFKLLDIEEQCLVLLNKKYFFNPIKQEVLKVYNYAMNVIENGCRL
jgi:hypothetical protein